MGFRTIDQDLRLSEFSGLRGFPDEFEELDGSGRDRAKRFNFDSDLPEYVKRGTVSVWKDDSENSLLRKTEKRNVKSQVNEKDFQDFSELEKAIMFGELGISPRVHSFNDDEAGMKRDYTMEFLGDYTNFEDKSFDSIAELEPYAESTGRIMGVLNQLDMVHGDIISSRSHSSEFPRTPVLNNLLVGGSSEDVKMIDPEVTRFSNPGESHRWDRASSSYDMIERTSPSPNAEASNVWTALVSEAICDTELGSLVDEDEIVYVVKDENNVQRTSTDFLRYLEERSSQNFYELECALPRFEFGDGDVDEYFEDDETTKFAEEVRNITESYVGGFEEGKNYVSEVEWTDESESAEEYLQELRSSLQD